jgi:hypothetical protein
VMPVPDPSPDAGRRHEWWRFGCVTVGGTITVLVATAAAILRTGIIRRAVIAPLFETVIATVPVALR